jgi:phosphate transport system protein
MELHATYLKDQLIEMFLLVKKIIPMATDLSVPTKDVLEIENQINTYHTSIDDYAFKFMALKRPLARDLRLSIATIKINTDLERIGDQAVKVRRSINRVDAKYPQIESMMEETSWMIDNALEAFINSKVRLSFDVIEHDKLVNDLNRNIIKTYLTNIKNRDIDFEDGFNIIQIAKSFERIGDHTKNIAEDIIFLESGEDIRHNKVTQNATTESNLN